MVEADLKVHALFALGPHTPPNPSGFSTRPPPCSPNPENSDEFRLVPHLRCVIGYSTLASQIEAASKIRTQMTHFLLRRSRTKATLFFKGRRRLDLRENGAPI